MEQGKGTERFVRLRKQPLVLPCQIGGVNFGMYPQFVSVDAARLPYLLKNFSEWMEECDERGQRPDDKKELKETIPPEVEKAIKSTVHAEPDQAPAAVEEKPADSAAQPESPKRRGSRKKS